MAKGLEEGRLKSYIIMMTRILYINCQARADSRKGVPGVRPPPKDKDSEWRDREIKCAHGTC